MDRNPISSFREKNIGKTLTTSLKLNLNKQKTDKGILTNSNYFVFLGYKISRNNISVSDYNIEKFTRRIAGKFTWFKNGASDENKRPSWLRNDIERYKEVFIAELNEMITGSISERKNYGWLFFFSAMNDLSLLFKLDRIIQRFFNNEPSFQYTPPNTLKRLVRTFYVINFSQQKSYINNYDSHDTIIKKRNFLVFRGRINPELNYTDAEIESIFFSFKTKKIKNLERDLGYHKY